jgi:voltage-gated potassium channel
MKMPLIRRLVMRVADSAAQMTWPMTALFALAHILSCYLALGLIGESDLVATWPTFIYFYVVTSSSVGYGDLSPATEAGRLFAATWLVPGGFAVFGLVIGKIISTIKTGVQKKMNGLGNFAHKQGHIVVVGHIPGQTDRLLEETTRLHGTREVMIVATQDLSNTLFGSQIFIRATSLSSEADLRRAGVVGADFVVILAGTDDESLAAALAVGALDPKGHCVAYFREQSPARLVESHCPNIDVVTSTSVEQVARALSDPGAGQVLRFLVNTDEGATLNSMTIQGAKEIKVADLMARLLKRHGATLIGYRSSRDAAPVLSLTPEMILEEGQTIYYIADHRICDAEMIAA